jgi:HlyD family secretion protein
VTIDDGGKQEAVVRARLDAPPPGLRHGMSAIVRFTAAWQHERLAVPNHAVAGGGAAVDAGVWTVRDGVIALVPIVLGLRGDFHTEVLAGLTPGMRVVTGPAAIIRTLGVGDRVVPIPAAVQAP